jgi:hypothetical protein
MSFREYDKKVRCFRPVLEYWDLVLTQKKPREDTKTDGTLKYDADEIKLMKKADRIACTNYILENGGITDVYTEDKTAYEIRESLRSRFENTESWGLTVLTEKFNEVLRINPNGCPDEWFNQLQYYSELIVRAGGAQKTPAEIVAHVIGTAPKMYDLISTPLSNTDLAAADIVKVAREQYRNYWRRHFEARNKFSPRYRNNHTAYQVESTQSKHENVNYSGGNSKKVYGSS